MSKERKIPASLPILYRAATFDDSTINEKDRTVEVSFSSETPVRNWFGNEILSHDPKNVRMGRFKSGTAPLLFNHNPNSHIGVIDRASIDDDKVGRAKVRFGNSPLASEK